MTGLYVLRVFVGPDGGETGVGLTLPLTTFPLDRTALTGPDRAAAFVV